jgi:site-specific DNA recombinase
MPETRGITARMNIRHAQEHLYQRVTDDDRRKINQAVFQKIYIDDDTITEDQLHEPFAELVALQHDTINQTAPTTQRGTANRSGLAPVGCSHPRNSKAALLTRALQQDHGSSKAAMVELRGIEPLTSSLRTTRSTN